MFWEWGGRTVSPHPHAHSTHDFVVHPLTQTFLPLHKLLNTQALQFHILSVAVHLHALPIWMLIVFTHRNFPRFYPRDFLLQIRVLSIAVHSHAEGFPPVFRLHAQDFAGFTHAVVFFCGFVNNVGGSFPRGLTGGSMLLLLTQHAGSCWSRSPMISCRRPFHAQELCAVCVILTRLLSCSGTDCCFPML